MELITTFVYIYIYPVLVEQETLVYTELRTVMRVEIYTDTLIGNTRSIVQKVSNTKLLILDYLSHTLTRTSMPFHMLLHSDLIPLLHLVESASLIF